MKLHMLRCIAAVLGIVALRGRLKTMFILSESFE